MSYAEMAAEIVSAEYPDFEVVDDAIIVCPHGHSIEYDGRCPDGCESPLLTLGLI